MFNKLSKFRSGARGHAQTDSIDYSIDTKSPRYSNGVKKASKKSALRGEDFGHLTDSEVYFAESLFPVKTSSPAPVRKLQRSSHTIDTSLLPAVLDMYDRSSPRSPVSTTCAKSYEIIKEQSQPISKKSWIAEVTSTHHSNGDSRRKSCEPVLRFRSQNGDRNNTVASDSTFSRRDNSSRSWTTESTSDEENIDRSMSSAFYKSDGDDDSSEAADYADAEEKFLQTNPDYFEILSLENVRREQYPKLSLNKHVYMDYASLALSSRFQIEEHMKIVTAQGHMFSGGPGSSDEYAAMAQGRLLQMFKTSRSEYSVVFTTGLNASYRLVANSYP